VLGTSLHLDHLVAEYLAARFRQSANFLMKAAAVAMPRW
jgi:hypothetical protein